MHKLKTSLFALFALLTSLAFILLAIVDLRRGFLFDKAAYVYRTSFFAFSPWQIFFVMLGLSGLFVFSWKLERPNPRAANFTLWGIFILLLIDAGMYRGVAAARALNAGSLSLDWLNAFGVDGLLKPIALSASYVLTVWHAIVLSCLGAGLAFLVLPRLFKHAAREVGWRGSLAGAFFALSQPFCSCCVAMTSKGLFRSKQSLNFAIAVLLGAPLMNISTFILAGNLLPWPFAVLRILGGILTTIFISFLVSRWMSRGPVETRELRGVPGIEEDTPSVLLKTWLKLSARVALIMIPAMILGTILSAIVWGLWPKGMGNTVSSVIFTSLIGSLVMVSTWTEIPLASQMIHQGMTGPGAAALMALPAVNLGSLLIIGKISRNWKMAAGLGLGVVCVSICAGLVFL